MSVSIPSLLAHFKHTRVTQGINGIEIVVRDCPIDQRGLGSQHPEWKLYLNPMLGVGKCFVCHSTGEGASIEDIVGRKLPEYDSSYVVPERPPVCDLPDGLQAIGIVPEAIDYLTGRNIHPAIAEACGLLWKPTGVSAWDGKFVDMPGLIIPTYLEGDLVAWQFGPVPRMTFLPKYINAPNSRCATSLFNWENVKGYSDVAVLVEGVFDVLRIPDIAIGLFTNNITTDKVSLLTTGGFRKLVLCLDGNQDETHVRRQLTKIRNCARLVASIRIPADKDPCLMDEALLRNMIANAH